MFEIAFFIRKAYCYHSKVYLISYVNQIYFFLSVHLSVAFVAALIPGDDAISMPAAFK